MRSIAVLLAFAIVAMLSVSVLQYEQLRAMRSMEWVLREAAHLPQNGDSMSTTYPSTGGPHTVTTDYQDHWTPEQWKARHDARVAADQADGFPIVVPN